MAAKRIEDMPREYALLMNPEQRRAALGDQRLKISGADFGFGGTDFYQLEWDNVHFYDCIFYGVFHLTSIRNCVFEHCQFPGSNFQAYDFEDVLFLRSDTIGEVNLIAGDTSKNVRFMECDFGGKNSNVNRYGVIYFYQDVSFERCSGQYMDVSGNGIVTYRDCSFGPIQASNGTASNRKKAYATVTVHNCTFKGGTRIARSALTSLTIRNSKFDVLDIGSSDVSGDVLIEDVQAGAMINEFYSARSITVRNSKFRSVNVRPPGVYPKVYRSFKCLVPVENRGNLKSVVLDGVECGHDEGDDGYLPNLIDDTVSGCWIMGGVDTTVIRNCKIPKASLWLESANVTIDNYEGEKASFVTSKIGSLTFRATAIAKAIDFTGVQVQRLDAKGLVRFAGQKIVTVGSNVHLP
ncbi:hypothetical protein [Cupriavidus sp. SW-Y-13]|uniref:hypothetical protein n=1 Tax=Cupriavidus sp. SW-Y-13 TaxID=2653854 RepID=UPI001365A203|nr:hypothetical protein [Cupriavidus sp. SW-Y-13]MWL87331.1 hypothetical protein [Cupriavidus sp. SW-Y-13]